MHGRYVTEYSNRFCGEADEATEAALAARTGSAEAGGAASAIVGAAAAAGAAHMGWRRLHGGGFCRMSAACAYLLQ